MDKGNNFYVCNVNENMLNNHSQTAKKGWSSKLEVRRRSNVPCRNCIVHILTAWIIISCWNSRPSQ